MVTVDGGVEEVVDSLLERGEHEHRLLHLRQPEARDPQHLPHTLLFHSVHSTGGRPNPVNLQGYLTYKKTHTLRTLL